MSALSELLCVGYPSHMIVLLCLLTGHLLDVVVNVPCFGQSMRGVARYGVCEVANRTSLCQPQ
jgi:hypothetical protein